jgi:hypothetical protein
MRDTIFLVLLTIIFSIQINAQFLTDIDGNTRITGLLEVYKAGTNNTYIGFEAGKFSTGALQNTVVGYKAGFLIDSGSANVFFGLEAGRNNIDGSQNSAIGRYALANNQYQNKNVALGTSAFLSMMDGWGNDPVAGDIDLNTMYNVAIGTSAGQLTNDPSGFGAERNTFVGGIAGVYNSTGYRNTFNGFFSGKTNNTGTYLTCIGNEANVSANGLTNAGVFGADAIVNASNKIRIGDGAVNTVEGQGWSLPSDGRFKYNVSENVPGLSFVMRLRPVTYNFDLVKFKSHVSPNSYRDRELDEKDKARLEELKMASNVIQTGFIAQEVENAALELGFDFNGIVTPKNDKDNYGISYSLFVVPLIKAVQEQQEMIDELLKTQLEMQKELDALRAKVNDN